MPILSFLVLSAWAAMCIRRRVRTGWTHAFQPLQESFTLTEFQTATSPGTFTASIGSTPGGANGGIIDAVVTTVPPVLQIGGGNIPFANFTGTISAGSNVLTVASVAGTVPVGQNVNCGYSGNTGQKRSESGWRQGRGLRAECGVYRPNRHRLFL
jgi:hypothetical protein